MPRAVAERLLLAPVEDVWRFLAEPHHLADWWPGVAAVEPDRRGLAPGARWTVRTGGSPSLLRRARAEDTILIRAVNAPTAVSWQHVRQRLEVELALEAEGAATLARLTVSGPWLVAFARSLPREALARLHGLIQTAASL